MNRYFAFLEELDVPTDGVVAQAIALLRREPAVTDVVQNTAVTGIADFFPYRGEEQLGRPFYGAVEFSAAGHDMARGLFRRLSELGAKVHGYHVTAMVEKDELPHSIEGRVPGLKTLRGIFFHADLTPQAARRCWDHHVALALEYHGFDKYVRYWVEACLTEDSPQIGGITNLQFASEERMRSRYFLKEGGSALVFHDVSYFISGGTRRLLAEEHAFDVQAPCPSH